MRTASLSTRRHPAEVVLLVLLLTACGADNSAGSAADTGAVFDAMTSDATTSDAFDGGTVDAGLDAFDEVGDSGRPDTPPAATPAPPSVIVGASSCLIDLDCEGGLHCFLGTCSIECDESTNCGAGETCSTRGRCIAAINKSADGESEGAVDEVLFGRSFEVLPSRVQTVPRGVELLDVTAVLDGDAPSEGLSYRVEGAERARTSRVLRARTEGANVTFAIPTGAASAEADETELEEVNVVTSVGSFRLRLVPQPPVAGEFAGEVQLDTFGNIGLPIEMMLVVDPPEATLEEAVEAWLLLPMGEDRVFSPRDAPLLPDDATEAERWQAQTLEFDDFTERWVARFDNEYRLSDDSLLGALPPGQVERTIRIELEPGRDGALLGSLTDRWTGLYDERNRAGVLDSGVINLSGDFEVFRVGSAFARASFSIAEPSTADPGILPLPPLDACDDSMMAVDPIDVDGSVYDCAVGSVDSFAGASDTTRADCAIAVAENALAGETTAASLAAFLDGSAGGERSFSEFMAACAAGIDGECRPTAEVECGRQLLAFAYVAQADGDSSAQLVETFQTTTREAFLGRQLGAFQTDADKRLEWLRTTDYPAIVTAAVQDLSAQLLDEWIAGVLGVHVQVLAGQFDASGIAVLARQAEGGDAADRRRALLLEMGQSWRATMEALTLLAQRWDALYQDTESRARGRDLVASYTLDLYVTAGLLGVLNRNAGAGFNNSAFGAGFGALGREGRALALPFEELVYARDAEVVVSTSLDPEANDNTVLRELTSLADGAIEDAAEAVQDILAENQARALNETQLRDRLANDIDELRSELVSLCGLPAGCELRDYGTVPSCTVRTAAAECGFLVDGDTGEVPDLLPSEVANVSEAGERITAIEEAMFALQVAESERDAHIQRANRAYDDAAEFARVVEEWNDQRLASVDQIEGLIATNDAAWNDTIRELTGLVADAEDARAERVENARTRQDEWESVEAGTRQTTMGIMAAATGLELAAGYFESAGEEALMMSQIIKEGFPTSAGTANDLTSSARMTVLMQGFAAYKVSDNAATVAGGAAAVLEATADSVRARSERRIRDIRQESEFESAEYDDLVAGLRDQADLIEQEQRARDVQLDNLIEALIRTTEAELAYERDIVELNDRRSAAFNLLNETPAYQFRVLQAEQQLAQRFQAYDRVAQQGGLVDARLAELESQRENVNLLLGSPDVVFAWANRLEQAELRLDRAKEALMDWLVAMEYFAVRPFMDQRLQILLARNPYQLEEIAAEMERLQRSCGGALNEQQTTVSLNAILGLDSEIADPEDGVVYGPAERLRATLARGAVPIDTRTRTRTDESVGQLLGNEDVWAATFGLELGRFANLASTCNAKIVSFDVQLVGEDLGAARPTVSILYDGTSALRSCQPGIQEYVDQFGPESTAFGPITTFKASSRSVSPVAGVGEFPSDAGGTGNLSLGGLPLASQYTLLIDRGVGENAGIDWGNLEDVLLRVNYAYQDVFPDGQCE